MPEQHVLAREVAAVVGLGDVHVDALQVGLRVGHGLGAARADRGGLVDLLLEFLLGVGRVLEEVLLEFLVGGRATGERGQLAPADPAQHVHQEEPVLGGGVARAELGARARRAVDVRHAGRLVADDRHVGARFDRALDLVGPHAERRVVEELVDLVRGQALVTLRERVVFPDLVGEVRRPGADRLVGEDFRERGVAVLTWWDDVAALAEAVVLGRERGRSRRRGLSRRGLQGESRTGDHR